MSVNVTARPFDLPSNEEDSRWTEEGNAFLYVPPNQQAASGSAEFRGWGIHPAKLPPPDAVSFVIGKFREEEHSLRDHDRRSSSFKPMHPAYRWGFISACTAHFLWFRSPAGAKWVMRMFGVEEVPPFYEGYAYFWMDQKTGGSALLPKPTYDAGRNPTRRKVVDGVELRIFREWEKNYDPPCSQTNRGPVEEMKTLMNSYRNPYMRQDTAYPSDDLFFYVSEILRDWFLENKPDRNWPTVKADRIVGWQWVQQVEREPGVKFFEALQQVGARRGRAYRLKDAQGGIHWCSGSDIRIVPLKDVYLEQGMMSEEKVDAFFVCQSCRKRKACTPYTGENRLCCHCFAVEVERDPRPTLMKCTMDRECKRCPDVLNTHQELVQLQSRLSRPARTGPVPR